MSLPQYPQYRETGNVELGSVPEHWSVAPLHTVARVVNGYPFDSAEFDTSVGIPLIRIRDLDRSETESFFKGEVVEAALVSSDDVLVGMDGDFNVGRWRGEGLALLNQRMCCVRAKTPELTRFFEYVLPSRLKAINDVTFATTVKHLSSRQVERLEVAVPTEEQELRRIVAFLDVETRRIDELVEEQRQVIALLDEKRQAVISHAVTKGLNPQAKMQESGVEVFGSIPGHWSVARLKACCETTSGGTPNTARQDLYYSDALAGTPWIRTTDLQDAPIDRAEVFITEEALRDSACEVLPPGTVLVSMYGGETSIGKCGLLEIPAAINQALCGLLPSPSLTPRFLLWFLQFFKPYWMVGAESSRKDPNISQERVRNSHVVLPPRAEQDAIVAWLDAVDSEVRNLTSEATAGIALLLERRSALITAAVTGQIDVRALAPTEAP